MTISHTFCPRLGKEGHCTFFNFQSWRKQNVFFILGHLQKTWPVCLPLNDYLWTKQTNWPYHNHLVINYQNYSPVFVHMEKFRCICFPYFRPNNCFPRITHDIVVLQWNIRTKAHFRTNSGHILNVSWIQDTLTSMDIPHLYVTKKVVD